MKEVAVTRSALWRVVIVVSVVLAVTACRRYSGAATPAQTTQTVAPAAAQPAPTGTDAMTQTVNVDDGRSEEEGPSGSDATATSATAPHAVKAHTAKKHK